MYPLNRCRLIIATVIIFLWSCVAHAEWWDGGTLHGASVAEWHAATPENRLATAGDFVSVFVGDAKAARFMRSRTLIIFATNLVTCIEKLTRGVEAIAKQDVAQFAAMCLTMMGVGK